jgi:ketosteroid isomerase-like protein
MSTDPAMNTVRACYEALARRDLAAFVALLADDCVMYEAGGSDVPHSGTYRGRHEALLFHVEDGQVKAVRNFYADIGEAANFWSN